MPATQTKTLATLAPQASPQALGNWWQPIMGRNSPESPIDTGYFPFKVLVTAREAERKGDPENDYDRLTFVAVSEDGSLKSAQFTVDLLYDLTLVWPELPSTAQRCEVGQYGWLFLSLGYINAKRTSTPGIGETSIDRLIIPGGKWPASGEYLNSLSNAVTALLQDAVLRNSVGDVIASGLKNSGVLAGMPDKSAPGMAAGIK